jgi:catechol 2,3-dioxygenase-like lactoylglutathione lyase family enzyme
VANGKRKPLGSGRVTLAITLGTLGLYTAAAGLGMGSWGIGAIGVAALVLGVSLLLTSSLRGAERAWVTANGLVLEAHEPPSALTHARCEMQVQIEAPGHPPASVRIRDPRVPVSRWPRVGMVLPLQVASDDIRRVKVLWDEVDVNQQSQPRYMEEGDIYAGVTSDETYRPRQRREADYVYDIDAEPDLPPPPSKPRPSPRQRKPDAPVDQEPETGDGPVLTEPSEPEHRGYTVDANGLIEGDLLVAPPSIDIIDFGDIAATPPQDPPRVVELLVGVPGQGTSPSAEPAPADDRIGPLGGAIHGVGVTLLVVDVGRSVAFYRDMLGFHEIDSGPGNAVLSYGDTRIVLRRADEHGPTSRRTSHLNLEVSDLDSVYRRLRLKGISFTYAPRVTNRGERLELWSAAFQDPDGHAINLSEWRTRT